jgi:hypothetical protein
MNMPYDLSYPVIMDGIEIAELPVSALICADPDDPDTWFVSSVIVEDKAGTYRAAHEGTELSKAIKRHIYRSLRDAIDHEWQCHCDMHGDCCEPERD